MDACNATHGHRLLRDYVHRINGLLVDMARALGLTPMQLAHLLKLRRGASIKVARSIEDRTGGAIPMWSWAEADAEDADERRQKLWEG